MGKQNFHEIIKKVFEPVTDTFQKTSEDCLKTMMLTSNENSKTLENRNDKLLGIKNHTGIIATYLLSPLLKITNLEKTSQYKLIKDISSNWVYGLLISKTIPVTLYKSLLTFRDTDEEFKLEGEPLENIFIKNYTVDLASLPDKK